MDIELQFADDERLRKIQLAVVELREIDWARAGEVVPLSLRDEVLRGACNAGAKGFETRIKAVRDMLRNGRYKPAGRAKPSSEYLLAAALDGSFPRVNPLVDAVNLASLKYMYPMSIFDADRAGQALLCRLGAPGEHYVFNSSGQKIDVEDLVCLCALKPAFTAAEGGAGAGTPEAAPNISGTECGAATAEGAPAGGLGAEAFRSALEGEPPPTSSQKISPPAPRPQGVPIVNPVRDSMATKLFEGARNAVIVIYAPGGPYEAEGRDIEAAAQDLAAWCGSAAERAAVEFASLP